MARTSVDAQPPVGVLAQLRALRESRAQLEREEAALVRRARHEGFVWEQIASALGVTRQAAHKKHRAGRRG